ncbi:glycosyltransferase [Amycolatopsis sp. NPDC006131]|uniref:glycosyltransferase family 2 protein n=1 Tax=Amycolatopsis sp. NPDC006131 TaxID=3156731 RepID=UPI0033A3709F
MTDDITVVIPSIPPRAKQLRRAIHSVTLQTLPAAAIVVEVDRNHEGAAVTRHRGLMKVDTGWVAFLDDDDTFDPTHLETLHATAVEYSADYVWSRFRIGYPDGSTVPGPAPLGPGSFQQWNDTQPAHTTITTLVRTKLAQAVGFVNHPDANDQWPGEDWNFTLRCRAEGGVFRHAPVVTWTWHHHGRNTSGLPTRWS